MKVRSEALEGGALVRLVLDAGKGNVVDRACIEELGGAHARAAADPRTCAVLLDHEGPHFSFGASVPEHLPGQVETMLPALHRLVLQLVESPIPVIACVKGACLGGGLEIALACTRIVAAPDAKLAQPEIQLGVFAPAGSVLLPLRVGPAKAAELLLSGATVTGEEARAFGLVDEVAADPYAAALAWCRAQLVPKSAAAIRFAHRATRAGTVDYVRRHLHEAESLYLSELMRTRDAVEGLRAFTEKRSPTWQHA